MAVQKVLKVGNSLAVTIPKELEKLLARFGKKYESALKEVAKH